jgi:hypothetical protein
MRKKKVQEEKVWKMLAGADDGLGAGPEARVEWEEWQCWRRIEQQRELFR